MSRKDGNGNLQRQDTITLLEAIASRLNDSRIKYWVIGGVLRDITELGEIAGPHSDIDFYILESDIDEIKECMSNILNKLDCRQDSAKVQYVYHQGKKDEYSIEFILLKDCADANCYSSATTGSLSNSMSIQKKFIGNGVFKNVNGLSAKIWIPSCPLELLEQLEA